jgi:hypothetical protein
VSNPIYVEQDAAKRQRMASPDFIDNTLGFGEFVMGRGLAYTMNESNVVSEGVAVAKDFVSADNRRFLVESLNYSDIAAEIAALPECAAPSSEHASNNDLKKQKTVKTYAAIRHLNVEHGVSPASQGRAGSTASSTDAPLRDAVPPAPASTKHAAIRAGKPAGVVIDYIAVVGSTLSSPMYFSSETNYCIGNVTCPGNVIFDSGAVLKYKTGGSLVVNGTATWPQSAASPVIFSAIDDNSVGECMSGVSGYGVNQNPSAGYANPALMMANAAPPITISNAVFRFCQQAVSLYCPNIYMAFNPYVISSAQFVGCVQGVTVSGYGASVNYGSSPYFVIYGNTLYPTLGVSVINTLFDNVQSPLNFPLEFPYRWFINESASFSQCTLGGVQRVANFGTTGQYPPSSGFTYGVSAMNSIFCNVTNLSGGPYTPTLSGNKNGFYGGSGGTFGSSPVTSTSYPFQTVGLGKYYLIANGVFIGNGATGGPNLAGCSTAPPNQYSTGVLSANATLTPVAGRYNSSAPNLGYYYPAIDYLIANVTVPSGVTVTVMPGTTIGFIDANSKFPGDGGFCSGGWLGLQRDRHSQQSHQFCPGVVHSGRAVSIGFRPGPQSPYIMAMVPPTTAPVARLRL